MKSPKTHDLKQNVIAIIGCGFSGTMTAVNLLRQRWKTPIKILIFEKSDTPGLGLAYGTQHEEHYLNVHAANMSAFVEDPDDLKRFIDASGNDYDIAEDWWRSYVRRRDFGKYIKSLLQTCMETQEPGHKEIEIIKDEVVSLRRIGAHSIECLLASGQSVAASIAVIAAGNAPPTLPRGLDELRAATSKVIVDPWQPGWKANISSNDVVLFVGTGLTMVDKVLELTAGDHLGKMLAVSRHGLLPQSHQPELLARKGSRLENEPQVKTCLQALQWLRKSLAESDADWRVLIDALRYHTQSWWHSLSLSEKGRFKRHLQCYWDIHRHRMAPKAAEQIFELINQDRLSIMAGRIMSAECSDARITLEIARRHSARNATDKISSDWIVNCTGPETRLEKSPHKILASLADEGLICANELGCGLKVTSKFQVVSRAGEPLQNLFALGPPLNGSLFETIAVPELRVQADSIAKTIHLQIESPADHLLTSGD